MTMTVLVLFFLLQNNKDEILKDVPSSLPDNFPVDSHPREESNVGKVFVATPDSEIVDIVSRNGGEAVLTKEDHLSGSDRIYEVYLKKLKKDVDLIINLQGDMPNVNPKCISKLEKFMRLKNCDIGTLGSLINDKQEIIDPNVVKV